MAALGAVTHAGGYCAIAVDVHGFEGEIPRGAVGRGQTGPVVGACLGVLDSRPRSSLHAHVAGVAVAGLGRGVGYAM